MIVAFTSMDVRFKNDCEKYKVKGNMHQKGHEVIVITDKQ